MRFFMKWFDMPETEYRASRLCRLLGNPKTYAIIKTLKKVKYATPSKLAQELNRRVNTISTHLKNLRNLDMVRYQRKGKECIYWLKDKKIYSIIQSIEIYIQYLRKL
jgi:predicted transcriptional regulator